MKLLPKAATRRVTLEIFHEEDLVFFMQLGKRAGRYLMQLHTKYGGSASSSQITNTASDISRVAALADRKWSELPQHSQKARPGPRDIRTGSASRSGASEIQKQEITGFESNGKKQHSQIAQESTGESVNTEPLKTEPRKKLAIRFGQKSNHAG